MQFKTPNKISVRAKKQIKDIFCGTPCTYIYFVPLLFLNYIFFQLWVMRKGSFTRICANNHSPIPTTSTVAEMRSTHTLRTSCLCLWPTWQMKDKWKHESPIKIPEALKKANADCRKVNKLALKWFIKKSSKTTLFCNYFFYPVKSNEKYLLLTSHISL